MQFYKEKILNDKILKKPTKMRHKSTIIGTKNPTRMLTLMWGKKCKLIENTNLSLFWMI